MPRPVFNGLLVARNAPPCAGATVKLRRVLENCTEVLALNDQYLKATAVGDVDELLELAACGRR